MPKRVAHSLVVAVLVAGMTIGMSSSVAAEPGPPSSDPAECLDEQEAEFLRLINEYRAENGAPELAASKALNRASYLHSKDMADNDYFEHESQDGRAPEDRMEEQGYDTGADTGENIAAGYRTAEEVFNIWRDSPGHNQNMLSEDFTVIGIGMASAGESEYQDYWTTDFGGETDAPPACAAPPV